MIDGMIKLIAHRQPISTVALEKIIEYSKRSVEAYLAAPEPRTHFGAGHYFKKMRPADDALPLRRFIHYIGTLDKYRGNAHLATWQHDNLEGKHWEVISEVWGGKKQHTRQAV